MSETVLIASDEEYAIAKATHLLDKGQVIALPTETVYGLAGDATNSAAVARIYETKSRPAFNPLICHVCDLAMAKRYVRFDATAEALARRFWPGPLTLVLPYVVDGGICELARAGLQTLAVRAPRGFAATLIARFDKPLAAPSANTSGKLSPTHAAHVVADLGDRVPLILDAGPASVGLESTIVKIADGNVVLLRPGGIAAEDIETEIGQRLVRSDAASAIEAPGMLASHYAPETRLRIDASQVAPDEVLINFAGQPIDGADRAAATLELSAQGSLREAAAELFDSLKRADGFGAQGIAVAPIPNEGLGEAINDRLKRAAAPPA